MIWACAGGVLLLCLLSVIVGYRLGKREGNGGKCRDRKIGRGLWFDGCDYVLKEVWQNVSVDVARCRKCGNVDISWHKQDNSVKVYEDELEDEDAD